MFSRYAINGQRSTPWIYGRNKHWQVSKEVSVGTYELQSPLIYSEEKLDCVFGDFRIYLVTFHFCLLWFAAQNVYYRRNWYLEQKVTLYQLRPRTFWLINLISWCHRLWECHERSYNYSAVDVCCKEDSLVQDWENRPDPISQNHYDRRPCHEMMRLVWNNIIFASLQSTSQKQPSFSLFDSSFNGTYTSKIF